MANIKDLEIQFTDEQITAFGGILYVAPYTRPVRTVQ